MKLLSNIIRPAYFADTKPHYELLDGLRGVAALLVVIYHIFEGLAFAEATDGVGSGLITTLNHGHIAVDFFFILSGFVISYAYDDRWSKMSLGGFFKRRLIRLHPMLIIGAIIGAASFFATGCERWDGSVTPTSWVMVALMLTMCMIPAVPGVPYEVRGNGEMFPLNGPGWSLFFEYIGNVCYALFIRRMSTKVLAFFTLLLGIAHAWFFVGDVSGYDMIGVGWTIDAVNFWGGFIRMLFPFSIGMLLARTFRPRKIKGAFWICTAALIVLFAVPYIPSANGVSLNSLYEFVCIAFIFPALVWIAACGTASGVTGKANTFLGELSYPLYIVHYPIMYIFYKWLIQNDIYTLKGCWPVALLVVASSIALAYLCLKFYDEPVRRWLSKRLR
ncbi:MAG: acyltransferase [Bacteroidales bacterium]|nr:acyltransferase [Bacteroidales bacterium]